jgi:hypothetical protein
MGKNDHFVPQLYLRQFRFEKTEKIVIATIEPFKSIGLGKIKGQCQADYFYEKDLALDEIHQQFETQIAPILVEVCRAMSLNDEEIIALRCLAVELHVRTRKAVEAYKVLPRYLSSEIVKDGIARGKLPEPKGGWKEEMLKIEGAPGALMETTTPKVLEMQTLHCKMLRAKSGGNFITSDNPVVVLNQFCANTDAHRSFAGFGMAGFQLVLPISPSLCLIFYDPKVYKVGGRRKTLVDISEHDVEIVNSLQVQSADKCLYSHSLESKMELSRLVARYARLRTPVHDSLRIIPGKNADQTFLHTRMPSAKLPTAWAFCRYRKHRAYRPGDLRDPAWSETIRKLLKDIKEDPDGGDVFDRLRRITLDQA